MWIVTDTYLYHSVCSLSVIGNKIVLWRPNAMQRNYSYFSRRQCKFSIVTLCVYSSNDNQSIFNLAVQIDETIRTVLNAKLRDEKFYPNRVRIRFQRLSSNFLSSDRHDSPRKLLVNNRSLKPFNVRIPVVSRKSIS